jgi:hypothetical protein
MFKIELKSEVIDKIDNFIDWYLNSFLSLFIDSWIKDVYLIEENYKNIATKFRDQIYSSLQETCEKEIIFWKKVWDKNQLSIIISIWNYKLFVDYKEDEILKIRFIENIEFYKK